MGAGNRDPRRFASPDRFDPRPSDAGSLSLGGGPHFCLGAALARMEASIAFHALLAQFPAMAAAGEARRVSGAGLPRLRKPASHRRLTGGPLTRTPAEPRRAPPRPRQESGGQRNEDAGWHGRGRRGRGAHCGGVLREYSGGTYRSRAGEASGVSRSHAREREAAGQPDGEDATFTRPDGHTVTVTVDASGKFTVRLAAGSYTALLAPTSLTPARENIRVADPARR